MIFLAKKLEKAEFCAKNFVPYIFLYFKFVFVRKAILMLFIEKAAQLNALDDYEYMFCQTTNL